VGINAHGDWRPQNELCSFDDVALAASSSRRTAPTGAREKGLAKARKANGNGRGGEQERAELVFKLEDLLGKWKAGRKRRFVTRRG